MAKVLTHDGAGGMREQDVPLAVARELLAAVWDVAQTKTNLPATFADVYAAANSDGHSQYIDAGGFTQVRLVVLWNKIGSGTHTVQLVEVGAPNVLASMNVASGRNDSGLAAIPAALLNTAKHYKLQAKSTNAADDPVFEGARVYLK